MVDAIDASVSWRGDGDVVFITVCDFIGIVHRRVVDHDVETIVEVYITGVGLGAIGSALRTALGWEPRNAIVLPPMAHSCFEQSTSISRVCSPTKETDKACFLRLECFRYILLTHGDSRALSTVQKFMLWTGGRRLFL
jgi:hypothetical protein